MLKSSQMGTNSPLGRRQRVNGNSRLTCNTTIYPEFVTVKFQHLTICRSRLCPEDTPISLVQDQIGLILGGFWAIVQANICLTEFKFSPQLAPVAMHLSWKFQYLRKQGGSKFCIFLSNFDPMLPPEDGRN